MIKRKYKKKYCWNKIRELEKRKMILVEFLYVT